jgi:hypothetical protein
VGAADSAGARAVVVAAAGAATATGADDDDADPGGADTAPIATAAIATATAAAGATAVGTADERTAAGAAGSAATTGGAAGRNTAAGGGDEGNPVAGGIAYAIGARAAPSGATRGPAAGIAYAIGARADGGATRGRATADAPIGAGRLLRGAPGGTGGAVLVGGGSWTIGICAAWLLGAADSAAGAVPGARELVACAGGAPDIDQGGFAVTRERGAAGGWIGVGAARGGGAELIADRGNGTMGNCAACAARSVGITGGCSAALVAEGVDDDQGELGARAPGQGAPAGHGSADHASPGADPLLLELAELGDPGLGACPRIIVIQRSSLSLTATSRR